MKAITVTNLVKRYEEADTNAVNSIDLEIDQGEFFAFLGPNGAGKTTTLSILNTTLSSTSGDVRVFGKDVEKNRSYVRNNIGVIFQNPSLDLNLSAEQNIRLHVCLYGMYTYSPFYSFMPVKYKDSLEELAEILNIDFKRFFEPLKNFSGGMKRKIEIIRSLMHTPKVLFLDEPTTGLDPQSRKELWKYIEDTRQEYGVTIFLTTHYLEEAEKAEHVSIIVEGDIVADGSPDDLKNQIVKPYVFLNTNDNTHLTNLLSEMEIEYEITEGKVKAFTKPVNIAEISQKSQLNFKGIKVHNPTLEDAYLQIINESNE